MNISANEVFEYEHFEDEKKLDEINQAIYSKLSLNKKIAVYKILRTIEDITKLL